MNSSSISSAVPTIKCEDTSPSPTGPVGTDGESGAYLSVNVNLSAAMMNLLAAESVATTTLRTPEIVNDVITMTNPLDQYNYDKNASFKLTPEDEERRRRRRERNKIAATKCRMKKRERTVNLVNESEILENQNIDLKAQLKDLEVQKRQLIDMLSVHSASCVKNNTCNARTSPTTPYNMLRAYEPPSTFPANYDTHSPYIRPESANILASSYTCATSINGDSPDTISLDATYMTPQTIELDYNRPDSVLSLPPNSDSCYITTDGYLPKATTILGHIEPETEYYEADLNYVATTPQCHNYPVNLQDSQSKLGTSLNDGCLV
ncbi:jg12746 [Pararge aegeria aegeria]|uniref:Jg12746 protein n=1 Tax=Pararge aegeria aegeria TaxID=348720 RepID=A0A8S4SCP6_9NEOP|nr:jg12746 [Pararge aegeria aegeria]